MKHLLLLLTFVLFASTSKADVLQDIAKIASSPEVAAFLMENNLKAKSISYYMTAYCAGGPSNYVIHTSEKNKCVWVRAGSCDASAERAQITVLSTSEDMNCP